MKQKGISLIALIITIIVIIILAVITIFGVNGVIEKAREAKLAQEIATEKEWVSAAVVQAKREMNNFSNETLGKALDAFVGAGKTSVFADSDKMAVQFQTSERYYLVDKDGVVEGPIEKVEDEYAGDITKNGQYDGSEEKPYQITCIEDLVAFSIMTHGGNTELGLKSNSFSGKYVELARTLDFQSMFSYNDYQTEKYGDLNQDTITENLQTELIKKEEGCIGFRQISFGGTFDGKGNTIKNLYMKTSDGFVLALFVGNAKEIKNLNITGEIINTTWQAAGIVGGSDRTIITNCKNYANVTGVNFVGGIATSVGGTTLVCDCENYGTITMTDMKWSYGGAGGIAGAVSDKSIENCKNYGTLLRGGSFATYDGATALALGGIVGYAGDMGNIKNCVNFANHEYGGIVGEYIGTKGVHIMNCYNIGNCKAGIMADTNIWGTSGTVTIINCCNLGECESGIVSNARTDWTKVAIELNMSDCYNFGKVRNGLIGLQQVRRKRKFGYC